MKYRKNNQNKHKRIVLTGGPCCGKTTTINELRKRGHSVLPEIAREIIAEGVYHPSKGAREFQEEILRRQILQEDQTAGISFLDRSALDGLAYSLLFMKEIPPSFFNHSLHSRYDQVFILDRFPLVNDGLRVENSDEDAQKIHDIMHQAYIFHGYRPIAVPRMPVEDRADFILDHIHELKGGAS